MHRITNIDTLGTDYTVADQNGNIIKNIKVIPHTEILDAALGPCTTNFESITTYLEKSIEVLDGNDDVDMYRVYWHATTDDEVVLSEVIEYAIKNGYNTVILEHLDPLAS